MRDDKALHTPWGLIRPVDVIGMWAHRHMHEFGTKREHFGNVAIAARKHAQTNPFAMMRGRPLDMETYLAGRVIGYPLTLFDCCLETDGALACIVTTRRARARSPAEARADPLGGAGVGAEPGAPRQLQQLARPWRRRRGGARELLWKRSELGPKDMDCAQIYDAFTPQVVTGLEDYGFCKRGEGGPVHRGRPHRDRRRAPRADLAAAGSPKPTSTASTWCSKACGRSAARR